MKAFILLAIVACVNVYAATRNAETPTPEAITGLQTAYGCDGEKPVLGPATINYYTGTHGGRLQDAGSGLIRASGLDLFATDPDGADFLVGTSDAPLACVRSDSDMPYGPSWNQVRLAAGIVLSETVHPNFGSCRELKNPTGAPGWSRADMVIVAIVNTNTRRQTNVRLTLGRYFRTEESCKAQ